MQKALNAHGADLNGDGEFGSKTLAAVKAFQKAKGLTMTGKGDAATRAALGLTTAAEPPANPTPANGIRVTGGSVNLRTGPGTTYDAVKAVARGTMLAPAETSGWRPVLVGGEVLWISEEYVETSV
jgi:peptidoglycan hydrolase-like protein with peptidoglycan-binding domain